jgi:hypothetical protein
MITNKYFYLLGTKVTIANPCDRTFNGRQQIEQTMLSEGLTYTSITVSTVFIETFLDHVSKKTPLFETAVFYSKEMIASFRFKNYHNAIHNHWILVDELRNFRKQGYWIKYLTEEFLKNNKFDFK